MLLAGLEYGDEALLAHLFGDCDLIGWLTSAPESVTPVPSLPEEGSSSPATSPKGKKKSAGGCAWVASADERCALQ